MSRKKRSARLPNGAERLTPAELGVDLDVDDPRLVWATGAKASSEWSSSYAASTACGPPCVFPKGGDIYNSWLAEREDGDPWIELELPAVPQAAAILVLETCGPGAVREIRDLERDEVLFEAKAERIESSRSSRALHVPLGEGTPAPRRLRLCLEPYSFGSEYHEIDAVALLTVPLDALRAAPPTHGPTVHRRYAPSELKLHDLRGDPRIVWAEGARASSEYSSGYTAKDATRAPKVFPRGGDVSGTWLSESGDRNAWIELSFPARERMFGFVVLETCGAGAVVKATDEHGETLWRARPEPVEGREARLLHVAHDASPAPRTLRLWVSGTIEDYREIDAVAILTAPFDELAEEPPPPPTPGEPDEGFAVLEGELLGASAERPFVHAILRTPSEGRAANGGGPLRLRVADGDEVELEIGRTTLYGAPLVRARGTWAEVSREAPWLAAAFADAPPADGVEVVLEGRRLVSEALVEVAGEVTAERRGGFRESARGAPERVVAHAISVGPLERTPFRAEGTDGFTREAKPHRPRATAAHPLTGWARGMGIATLACAVVVAIDVAIAGGAFGPISPFALLIGLGCAALGLELFGSMHAVPGLVRLGRSTVDRKVGFASPGWAFVYIAFASFAALIVLGALTTAIDPDASPELLACPTPALIALVLLGLWLRRHGRMLVASMRLAAAPEGASVIDARGRFTGTLGTGLRCSRSERYVTCSEHLGTDTTTDSDGHTVTHERWRNWSERRVDTPTTGILQLVRSDGSVVSASSGTLPESTDLGLIPQPPSERAIYASFASEHGEGDEATILGVVSEIDPLVVKPTLVMLGELRELRRRVAAQWLALLGLLAIAASPLAVWLWL